ncbi:MAG: exodeoxyribonuclease VII small subunit [Planctomycetota bacterium]
MSEPTESRTDSTDEELPFEAALDQLRDVIADLEGGRLGLEASLERFESGIGLLRRCRATLESAERQVELLTGLDVEGHPIMEPFDASATTEQAGAGRRDAAASKRPRKRKPAADDAADSGLF